MPRVSVIIPAFNAEQHLGEALRSVQSQTYDDYWLPAYLERLVSLHDSAGEGVGILACNAWLLQADRLRPESYMEIVRFPREVTLRRLLRANPFAGPLTRRDVVDAVGGFCPELSRAQDYDLWIRIVEAGYRVAATGEVLAVRRIRSHSWSSNVGVTAHFTQKTYRRALERGNLPPRERRVARRELRHARLIERVVSADGLSYRRALRTLPLLLLVLAEHPDAWRSLPRKLSRGRQFFAPVPPPAGARARRSDGGAAAAACLLLLLLLLRR